MVGWPGRGEGGKDGQGPGQVMGVVDELQGPSAKPVRRTDQRRVAGPAGDREGGVEIGGRAALGLGDAETVAEGVPALAIKGLFVLAVFYTIYFMRSLLLPIVLAGLVSLILYPAVLCLKRARIHEGVGAAIIVGTLAGFLVTGRNQFLLPATDG